MSDLAFRVDELANRLGAELVGPNDLQVSGLNTLELAGSTDMTFIGSDKHSHLWLESQAIAAVVTRGLLIPDSNDCVGSTRRALLFVENADLAMAELLALFTRPVAVPKPGIAESAFVDPSSEIENTVSIGPGCWIGADVKIGANTVLEANVAIHEGNVIGEDCHFRNGVVIRERCTIGNRVNFHSNVVIGTDGFGYRPDEQGRLIKIPHIGTVIIHDDVELGAGTTVDRGKFGATEIGRQTKIDNLCQIGHNVKIGQCCVISALCGIAGSTILGNYVQLGGQSGLADHIRIGDGAMIAAHSASYKDVEAGAKVAGAPAINVRQFWRLQATLYKLPEIIRKLTRQSVDG